MLVWELFSLSLKFKIVLNLLFSPDTTGTFNKKAYPWPSSHHNWVKLHWHILVPQSPVENSYTAKQYYHLEVTSTKHLNVLWRKNVKYLLSAVPSCRVLRSLKGARGGQMGRSCPPPNSWATTAVLHSPQLHGSFLSPLCCKLARTTQQSIYFPSAQKLWACLFLPSV